MLNRFPSTGFNRINLDWIMRKLKKVEDVTDNIGTAVEDAQQAAAEATTAAAGAVAAAADATQAAEDAVEAISTVTDQAAQAVQTANAAQSTATGASNTAATALSRANTAQTTADSALAQADLAREETADLDDRFPVSIADGGTGATTAAGARTNLGLAFDSGTSYCKLPDGTLMCWGYYNANNVATTAEGSLYVATVNPGITFPVPFVGDTPRVFFAPNGDPYTIATSGIDVSLTGINKFTIGRPNSGGLYIRLSWFAVGRWK